MDIRVVDKLCRKMDSDTLRHCAIAAKLAKEYEKTIKATDSVLSDAAQLHDIGKIYISNRIFLKNEDQPLTELENQLIHLHPYIGYEILKEENVEDIICKVVLYHHGTNPPHLALADLPECDDTTAEYANKLFSIDVYTALIEPRPYRNAYKKHEALKILKEDTRHNIDIINFIEKRIYREI